MILRFPPAPPELDWLKEHANACGAFSTLDKDTEKLQNLYRYLRWSDAYRNTTYENTYPSEHKVANGMLTKYYRLMRGEESPTDRERQEIREAEQALAESNAEIKRRKAAKIT